MLTVTNVTKKFGDLTAVCDLSFELAAGEVLGLVGQNGAGKSTTFKMILNFLEPTAGSLSFLGHQLGPNDLNEIGYMSEERGLYMDMTIEQQVVYFARLHGLTTKEAKARLGDWMDKLHVKGKVTSKIKELSKGNQQKVQLITTMIHEPKLLILDEPFSGLDPVNVAALIEVIKEARHKGAAVIFSSHNMQNVTEVSDKVLMLVNGKRRLYGGLDQVRASFERQKLYLEGDFDWQSLTGYQAIKDDHPGKILTFENEQQARACLEQVKNSPNLEGYRLLEPSLDDIFKMVLGGNRHE